MKVSQHCIYSEGTTVIFIKDAQGNLVGVDVSNSQGEQLHLVKTVPPPEPTKPRRFTR